MALVNCFIGLIYCLMVWLFREQHKKLDALEMELAAARQEGFVSKRLVETNGTYSTARPLVVIGILTRFGRQKNRDAIRNAWMGSGNYVLCFLLLGLTTQ